MKISVSLLKKLINESVKQQVNEVFSSKAAVMHYKSNGSLTVTNEDDGSVIHNYAHIDKVSDELLELLIDLKRKGFIGIVVFNETNRADDVPNGRYSIKEFFNMIRRTVGYSYFDLSDS